MSLHKPALRPPAASTAEHRKVGARKRVALRANTFKAPRTVAKHYASSTVAKCRAARAIAKCCATNAVAIRGAGGAVAKLRAASAVAKDRAVSAVAKSCAVSADTKRRTVTNLNPAPTASPDLPGDRAGARRIRGATEADPVLYPVRNGEAPATPRRRRRRSSCPSDSTGVGPPVSKETRVNVGATRVGNLFARLQLHLATARFLAELRADALWETACDNGALELDTLASGMAPEALAAPLHPRVPPGKRGDGDHMSGTPAHAVTCALEGRLRRGGPRRVSGPAAPDLPAVATRHFLAAVTPSGCGALATSDSGPFSTRGPAPARTVSFCGTRTAPGSTSALIASPATARIASDSDAFTISDATFNALQATPTLAVPNVTTSTTRHPPGPPPHRTAHQPFTRKPFSQEKGAR